MIYGPLAHTIPSLDHLNQSNDRIYQNFIHTSSSADLPPNALYLYVDVRDAAAAHVAALETKEASNKRFVVSKGQISSQQISDILRKNISELEARTPIGHPGESGLAANAFNADGERAEKVLGIKYSDATDTFVDLGSQLLAMERK